MIGFRTHLIENGKALISIDQLQIAVSRVRAGRSS